MKNKILKIIVLTMAVMVVFAGCGKAKETKSDANLNTAKKLVVGQNANYFPIIVAQKNGLFEEEFGDELVVEVADFANGPAMNEAVTSGQIDIANMGDMPTVQEKANGVDIKVISYLWDSPPGYSIIARKESGIKKLEDIKGKTIAFGIGTNMHKLFLKYLKAVGYTEDDVNVANMNTADSIAALSDGSVDAIIAGEPTLSQLIKQIGAIDVVNSEGYDKVITITYGRNEYLKQNPDIVARYLKVIDKSIHWIEENVDEAVRIVTDYYAAADSEPIRKYYESRIFKVAFDQELVDALADTIQFTYDQGTITEKFDVKDLVDDTYIKLAGLD